MVEEPVYLQFTLHLCDGQTGEETTWLSALFHFQDSARPAMSTYMLGLVFLQLF